MEGDLNHFQTIKWYLIKIALVWRVGKEIKESLHINFLFYFIRKSKLSDELKSEN